MPAQLSLDQELMGAEFSVCRTWRYALWRKWNDQNRKSCMFIGLNPSTADETADDPTIRRCIRFARDWGCGALYMLNLFGYRATDPKVMMRAGDPIGAGNDAAIVQYAERCSMIVAAWGIHGHLAGRDDHVRRLLRQNEFELRCLGKTKDGFPKHPLYVPASTLPQVYA